MKNGAPFLATAEWVKPTKDADGYYVLPSYTAPDGTVFQQLVKPDPDWWAMWDNVDATSKPTMPWDLLNENDDFTSTFSMKGSFDGPDAIGAMTMVNKEIKKVKVYSFTFTYSYPSWNEETQKMVMVETTSVSTWKGLDWDNFTSSITGSGKTTNKKDSSWMEFTMTGTGTHTGVPVKDANGFQTGGTFTEKQTETMNFTMSSGYSGKFDMSVEASGSWNQATGGSGIGKGTITGSIYYQGTEICRIYATGQGESKETATVEGYYTLADDGFVTKYPMEEDDIKAIIIGPGGGKSKASIKMSVIKPQN
ncbi:MAG: hypothetical protein AABY84_06435 [Candidatus Firestonebacteria bacterium]